MVRISIDIGGTFTDVVAESGNKLHSVKVLTTPHAPALGALEGVDLLLNEISCSYSDIKTVVHGTTLATNALIERRGAKTAFVTTAGFRDVLDMRYEKRFAQYDLNIEMPKSLVPRPLRFVLNERILADGSILEAPTDRDIDTLAQQLTEQDIEAVAVGFLHAYRNPSHEQYVADRLRFSLRETVTICQSAEVAGEIREYERFSTVSANAYVRPLISKYLAELQEAFNTHGFTGSFLMMLSGGGLTTLEQATRFPVRLIESGPAGGVAMAAHVAQQMGSPKTLSLDIGGTTAKICFIENGHPQTTSRFEVARAWRDVKGSGLPVRVPTVELVEIGAGGGSIATVDALGRLKVGPQSAGSVPGPACYGLGGDAATITDAHLTVGNISVEEFAGGRIKLCAERAQQVIEAQIQRPMGFENTQAAAAGIIELADEAMANAARVHGIELGHDISEFDLLVTGGGGALHAARIAEKLDIRRIIVPQNAGVGSAVGFLHSPVAFESATSVMATLRMVDTQSLSAQISDLLDHVQDIVSKAIPEDHIEYFIRAELRYQGQGLEISIPLLRSHPFFIDQLSLETTFISRYQEMVGFVLSDIPVELVSISVTASEKPQTISIAPVSKGSGENAFGCRSIYDLNAGKSIDFKTLKREAMSAEIVHGPVAITEAQTTTLVRPSWSVNLASSGHLVLERIKT